MCSGLLFLERAKRKKKIDLSLAQILELRDLISQLIQIT